MSPEKTTARLRMDLQDPAGIVRMDLQDPAGIERPGLRGLPNAVIRGMLDWQDGGGVAALVRAQCALVRLLAEEVDRTRRRHVIGLPGATDNGR